MIDRFNQQADQVRSADYNETQLWANDAVECLGKVGTE